MQTQLPQTLLDSALGQEAEAILRRCVHCGFCNATCPTYQLLGDELDGPRGRIYQIKQLLEGQGDADTARAHLDRCLTCRNCETTCPSGVQYSRLLDIGREQVETLTRRPLSERLLRWGLLQMVPFPKRFALGVTLGRALKGLLPARLRKAVPSKSAACGEWPTVRHERRVLLLDGCVQSVAAPEINLATARVLDHLGISAIRESQSACCGALDQHLSNEARAAEKMRRNIDAWWPLLQDGVEAPVEAIVSSASACGLQVKDYGHYLRFDADYAEKAEQVSLKVKDIAELIGEFTVDLPTKDRPPFAQPKQARIAFHAPCTLQHGQRLGGVVENILQAHGFELMPVRDSHLCCGSAGTYSIFQPTLSASLKANKLAALQAGTPQLIASANIGCLLHLREASKVQVKHWIELLVDCLPG